MHGFKATLPWADRFTNKQTGQLFDALIDLWLNCGALEDSLK